MCRRLFIMHLEDPETKQVRRIEAINPEIKEQSGKQRVMEGCLSCPDKWGYVTRPKHVVLKAQDRNGKWQVFTGEDLKAKAFCHEIDHLDGILFTSHIIEGETLQG